MADRVGIALTVGLGGVMLGVGYIAAAFSTTLWQYALLHGLLIGLFGSAATFGPLMTEASHLFNRRRGLAVSICASGNYLAGTLWPGLIERATALHGWRWAEIAIGTFCIVTMVPLAALLRRPTTAIAANVGPVTVTPALAGLTPNRLTALLVVAGFSCCVAMAMPQVHIVAYCSDLGFGAVQGANMLAVMLGAGIVSRIGSGWIADRIGGVRTLLLGSLLQGLSMLMYLGFDSLASLYAISALFGLVQGGLIPSYAIIVRACCPPREAGVRFGVVLAASLVGMAAGGWISGAIYDLTGNYRAAFANGLAWNVLNTGLALLLVLRLRPPSSARTSRPSGATVTV